VTETARAVIGLTLVAITAPSLPWVGGRAITRMGFTALGGAWVAYPLADRWQVWVLIAALTALAGIVTVGASPRTCSGARARRCASHRNDRCCYQSCSQRDRNAACHRTSAEERPRRRHYARFLGGGISTRRSHRRTHCAVVAGNRGPVRCLGGASARIAGSRKITSAGLSAAPSSFQSSSAILARS
jgi:hypothetical protein